MKCLGLPDSGLHMLFYRFSSLFFFFLFFKKKIAVIDINEDRGSNYRDYFESGVCPSVFFSIVSLLFFFLFLNY